MRSTPTVRVDTGSPLLLRRYCKGCHAGGKQRGGVALDALLAEPLSPAHHDLWRKVASAISAGDMPPDDEPKPTSQERAALASWIDEVILRLDCDAPGPGRVVLHRLNRNEYQNTIRDLLGTDADVSRSLPPDNAGQGFDNIASSLTMSPLLVERYLAAADRVLDAVIFDPERRYRQRRSLSAEQAQPHHKARLLTGGKVVLFSDPEGPQDVVVEVNVPFASRFEFSLTAALAEADRLSSSAAAASPLLVDVLVDDDVQATITLTRGVPRAFTTTLRVPAGPHRLRAAVRKAPPPAPANASEKGGRQPSLRPGARLARLLIDGPLDRPTRAETRHRELFFSEPPSSNRAEAARLILERFATRAFRRPVDGETLDALMTTVRASWAAGESFVAGVRQGLRAVLVSPRFLYRVTRTQGEGESAPVEEHALAERLSYFLWSTLPDEELRRHADAGTLRDNLLAQVRRMLADPRARALVDNFGGQWLQFRLMDDVAPAWFIFKSFTPEHRAAFREETAMLFESIMRDDRSVMDFLTADYTFVNELLARHYGIPDVSGPEYRRVSLAGLPRRGVLTHASTLTITSRSTRTSPVMRGKWVLEALLDTPPPPPPPDVPDLAGDNEEERRHVMGTLRSRLAAHRESPACAPCHARMDPIGFGLENFDGIGTYRETDNKEPIDASGQLTSGETFRGPLELVDLLAEKKRDLFVHAFASKLLVYALGRELEPADRCALDTIVAAAGKRDFAFSTFVEGVAASPPFLNAKPAQAQPAAVSTSLRSGD